MSRVYIAGIGTAGLIVASTVILLAVVSTLVAFRGWPAQDVPGELRPYIVEESQGAPQGATARAARESRKVVADARSARAAKARRSARARRSRPSARAARSHSGPATSGGAGGRSQRSEGGSGGPTGRSINPTVRRRVIPRRTLRKPATTGTAADQRPASPLEPLTRSVGDTSERLTSGLATALTPLSPTLGSTVQQTGDALAQQIRELGRPR